MKSKQLAKLGIIDKPAVKAAIAINANRKKHGLSSDQLEKLFTSVVSNPADFADHPIVSRLAEELLREPTKTTYDFHNDREFPIWGEELIDAEAISQMRSCTELPVAVSGALMPDAHLGYGLPIGGVLATKGAVIPYAVGVDIGCRVMLSIFGEDSQTLIRHRKQLEKALVDETVFGAGKTQDGKNDHEILEEEDWTSDTGPGLKDYAYKQLGTSGGGNHFAEFGELEVEKPITIGERQIEAGTYLALVSHSGSRGPGARVANYYSKLAMSLHPDLPKRYQHLSWLEFGAEGDNYWREMELMGKFSSANHQLIHKRLRKKLKFDLLATVENHHNFAWRQKLGDEEVIVHRKGATPAGKGELGYIPGTMTDAGYLVEGKGSEESLLSASHGAGRQLSRKKAKNTTTRSALNKTLRELDITLIGAGLDESPHAYKDIDEVMKLQRDLVKPLAKFWPKIVRMAND